MIWETVRQSAAILSLRKTMEQVFLDAFFEHVKKAIWNSQHRLTEGK